MTGPSPVRLPTKNVIGSVATRTGPVDVIADTSRRVVPNEKSDAVPLARNSGLSARVQLRISVKRDSPNRLWASGILDRNQETRTRVGIVATQRVGAVMLNEQS
jgi:hypothetical protein